jgi:hypothetical protein
MSEGCPACTRLSSSWAPCNMQRLTSRCRAQASVSSVASRCGRAARRARACMGRRGACTQGGASRAGGAARTSAGHSASSRASRQACLRRECGRCASFVPRRRALEVLGRRLRVRQVLAELGRGRPIAGAAERALLRVAPAAVAGIRVRECANVRRWHSTKRVLSQERRRPLFFAASPTLSRHFPRHTGLVRLLCASDV